MSIVNTEDSNFFYPTTCILHHLCSTMSFHFFYWRHSVSSACVLAFYKSIKIGDIYRVVSVTPLSYILRENFEPDKC